MSEYATLTLDVNHGRAEIGLNRPDSRNAITEAMCSELLDAMTRVQADKAVRAVVLYGHGRMFSAGGDLKAVPSGEADEVLENIYKPALMAVLECRVPVIAAIEGAAVGIACALATSCDLVVMADNAYLSAPFVGLGLIPDGGLSWHLRHHLGKHRATEVILHGRRLSAIECHDVRIANVLVDEGQALRRAREWADDIAALPPLAVEAAKAALAFAETNNLPSSMSFEAGLLKTLAKSADAQEGLAAFKAKRKPVFKGR